MESQPSLVYLGRLRKLESDGPAGVAGGDRLARNTSRLESNIILYVSHLLEGGSHLR